MMPTDSHEKRDRKPLLKYEIESIVGIIFPLSREHIDRFVEHGKTVFVKFYGKERVPLRLRHGSRLFFYQSGGGKEIVGEAKITEVSTGTLDSVWDQFGNRLFLTREELEAYVDDRTNIRMAVLVLEGAKKYRNPLTLSHSITMAGQYMTKKLFQNLISSRS